ncbi:MAG: 2-amino-4-hydroxy-6-hydroxymethyldihydropteridine diphosphokinase [Leptospirillum sp.]
MIAGVSLGGNLPGSAKAIEMCVSSMIQSSFFTMTGISSFSRTLAWGTPAPSYDNVVVVGVTRLCVPGFFDWICHLERKVPRRGKGRLWPRILDIDFLFSLPLSPGRPPDLILPHRALPSRETLRYLLDEASRQARIPADIRERLCAVSSSNQAPGSSPVARPGALFWKKGSGR